MCFRVFSKNAFTYIDRPIGVAQIVAGAIYKAKWVVEVAPCVALAFLNVYEIAFCAQFMDGNYEKGGETLK